MNRTTSPVLTVRGATKRFPLEGGRRLTAVRNLSFDIHEGECLAVIGESGCGKSTLARLVTGITPMTSGSVFIEGRDIAALSPRALRGARRQVQMIFQNAADAISPRMKIGTFLMEPWQNYRIAHRKTAKACIDEMLEKVRLSPDCLNRYPHQLSGGELQRVCIARAFSLTPRLLVCDEITSALDVSVQDGVMRTFRSLQQETGTACLFICHDLALVHDYSDRVMVMYLGNAVEIIPSHRLGLHALHPYTQGLLGAMIFIGSKKRGDDLKMLRGEPPSPIDLPPGCSFYGRCPRATDLCQRQEPPLTQAQPDHWVACHHLS